MAHIGIFGVEGWEREYLLGKLSAGGHAVDVHETPLDEQHLPVDRDYDVISVFVGSRITPAVLDAFPKLGLVTTRSTGYDHVDVAYAAKKGIKVGYVPHYGEHTVAEFAMGLILTLSRRLYESVARMKEGGKFSSEGLEGFDLQDKTLGVVGAGRIGRHLIKMAKGFDMRVIAYDRNPNPAYAQELEFSYKNFDEVLAESDVISLHVFYSPETHHLINKDNINKIKKGAVLINTARGPVVETEALALALKKGILAGAGLDVLEEEGTLLDEMGYWNRDADDDAPETNLRVILQNHILLGMPNVIITPHNAFNTREAKTRILDADFENITSFFSSSSPKYPVS